jgi:hypothetical protein
MKKHTLLTTLFSGFIFLGLIAGVNAQAISNASANSWLTISPSTRNVGMGGSLSALPDAYDEVDINPAAIGLLGESNFSFSQNFWAQGLTAEHLVYSQRLENSDGFSLGADYLNFGSIPIFTVSASGIAASGTYSPLGLNVYGGYGFHLAEGLRLGLAAHFIYDNIQQTMPDQTASFDGGLFYQMPGTPMSLSAVLDGLGWNLDGSSLPTMFKTGWAYEINFDRTIGRNRFSPDNGLNLTAEGDWSLIDPTDSSFGFGGEYWYMGLIAVRAGYRFADYSNISGLTGFSLGAGIHYMDWQLDYALTTLGDFGTSNQISLSLILGEEQKTPTPTPTIVVVHVTPQPTAQATVQVSPTPVVEAMVAPLPTATTGVQPVATTSESTWNTYRMGIRAYKHKDYETAVEYLKEAVDDPNSKAWLRAEDYAMLGIIYEYYIKTDNHFVSARLYYHKALKLDPKNETANKHLRRWE